MTTVLSQKGQIVLPSAVRQQMHLEPGQDFEVIIDDVDTISLRRISLPPNHGLIHLLQPCLYPFDLPPWVSDSARSIQL